jgi:[ribosomal protein S18]-alanine N-acetyltransferase
MTLALMNPTLRAPLQSDYESLASWIPDVHACLRWAGPQLSFPFAPGTLAENLQADGMRSYILAEGHASPLGFGQHWIVTAGTVHLARIIVAPGARGLGLGRLLCGLLIDQAVHATGASRVTLRVYRDNTVARNLYSSLGFAPVEAESSDDALFMQARAKPAVYSNLAHTAAPAR